MVRGIVNNFKYSSFSPPARPQFLYFLPPFARPLITLLLKECLGVAVLRSYKTMQDPPFNI